MFLYEVTVQGELEGDRQLGCLLPAGVFLVALFCWCAGASRRRPIDGDF